MHSVEFMTVILFVMLCFGDVKDVGFGLLQDVRGPDTLIGSLHDPVTWYKINILERKLSSGTSKTKQLVPAQLDVCLQSPCVTCVPAKLSMHHVTGSLKGLI